MKKVIQISCGGKNNIDEVVDIISKKNNNNKGIPVAYLGGFSDQYENCVGIKLAKEMNGLSFIVRADEKSNAFKCLKENQVTVLSELSEDFIKNEKILSPISQLMHYDFIKSRVKQNYVQSYLMYAYDPSLIVFGGSESKVVCSGVLNEILTYMLLKKPVYIISDCDGAGAKFAEFVLKYYLENELDFNILKGYLGNANGIDDEDLVSSMYGDDYYKSNIKELLETKSISELFNNNLSDKENIDLLNTDLSLTEKIDLIFDRGIN